MMLIQKRRGNKYTVVIRGVFIVMALFLILGAGAARERIAGVLYTVTAPLFSVEQSVREGMSGRLVLFRSKQALLEENKALKERNVFLMAEAYTLLIVRKENEELKEILDRRVPDRRVLLARARAGPGRSPYGTLLLDKGGADGVRVGDIATVYGDIALGVIDRAYEGSSIVKLFSSPGEETDALLGEGNVPIRAEGMGGGNFKARVPKGVVVKEGDSVVSPVLEVPLLGIVGSVESAPSDSFQSILFQVPINIYELKWVEILLESGEEEEEDNK